MTPVGDPSSGQGGAGVCGAAASHLLLVSLCALGEDPRRRMPRCPQRGPDAIYMVKLGPQWNALA